MFAAVCLDKLLHLFPRLILHWDFKIDYDKFLVRVQVYKRYGIPMRKGSLMLTFETLAVG